MSSHVPCSSYRRLECLAAAPPLSLTISITIQHKKPNSSNANVFRLGRSHLAVSWARPIQRGSHGRWSTATVNERVIFLSRCSSSLILLISAHSFSPAETHDRIYGS